MKDKFYKERAWIKKKVSSGVSKKELYNTVGMFSNKSKKKVMQQKGITSKEYDKRYNFLFNVFNLLEKDIERR